jgi:hypothetical protein
MIQNGQKPWLTLNEDWIKHSEIIFFATGTNTRSI